MVAHLKICPTLQLWIAKVLKSTKGQLFASLEWRVWQWIFSNRHFGETYENTQWGKVNIWKHTVGKSQLLRLIGVSSVDGCTVSRYIYPQLSICASNLFMIDIPPSVYCSFPPACAPIVAVHCWHWCTHSKCLWRRNDALLLWEARKVPWGSNCPQTVPLSSSSGHCTMHMRFLHIVVSFFLVCPLQSTFWTMIKNCTFRAGWLP